MDFCGIRIGFAMCGSFCTFGKAIAALESLCAANADVTPIMSEVSYGTDTRFGTAEYFRQKVKSITGKEIVHTIESAEPIGPGRLLDALVVLPCTGNTLAKLARGIADSCVTLAAKAHLRNCRPVVVAVSTNDGLGAAAQNLGMLLARENVFFVPFGQDDCVHKPNSLMADFNRLPETIAEALDGRQLQPILAV